MTDKTDDYKLQDRYDFSEQDMVLVDTVRHLLVKIIRSGIAVPKQLDVVTKISQVFQGLPLAGEAIEATVCLKSPTRHFGDHQISHNWTIEIEEQLLQVKSGGYFCRPETGGDSFECINWCASPGYETEADELLAEIHSLLNSDQSQLLELLLENATQKEIAEKLAKQLLFAGPV